MSMITFDTLEFTRKLREAGFDEKQAETVVRVIADAQGTLVTREHFDARMVSTDARITTKQRGQTPLFTAQSARLNPMRQYSSNLFKDT